MVDDVAAFEEQTATTLRRLRRWWAIAGLALFIATWKLWTPQTVFPQIPLLAWTASAPPFVDWLAVAVLCSSLVFATVKPESQRGWLAFVLSLGVLASLDQHRLQPWAWQLGLMAVCWSSAFRPVHSDLLLLRLLTISIYFWSAISKFDADFYSSHGQTLVEALFQAVGINVAHGPAKWKYWLAHIFPSGEFLVAVGLCWQRTRRIALLGAIALHAGLLLALGPTGLGHRPGVLLWNVAFIGHDWLLFGGLARAAREVGRSVGEGANVRVPLVPSRSRRTARALILFACVWPLAERWGLCDRWLAWSVYSARGERISVVLTDEGVRRLPRPAHTLSRDRELWLDQWSLTALDVPIYPQLRFQLGVIEWLRQLCGGENLIEVAVQHSQGPQSTFERMTLEQCERRRQMYWINTRPRGESLATPPQ